MLLCRIQHKYEPRNVSLNMGTLLRSAGIIALACLFLGAGSINLPATTGAVVGPAQASTCQAAVSATYAQMNSRQAINNAVTSDNYAESVQGYSNSTYYSIFQIDKTIQGSSTCEQEVLSFNVVFTLRNSTGGWQGYLVITENANLNVLGSEIQSSWGMGTTNSHVWAGEEAQVGSGTSPVLDAYVTFTEPTPSYPSTGCADFGGCVMADWTGLADKSGASDGNLAQDGVMATCVGSGCTPGYFAWYEMLPATWVACTTTNGGAVTISGSDSITVYTENEGAYGGSNTKYDFYIGDGTSGTSCYVSGQSYTAMSSPTRGEFITENPSYCKGGSMCTIGFLDSLDKFSSVPFTGAYIYSSSSSSGYINSFVTGAYDMVNQNDIIYGVCTGNPVTNVSPGTLN